MTDSLFYFWPVLFLLGLIAIAPIVLALWRARPVSEAPEAAGDLQVYRDQLRDVERDIARGTLDAAEGDRVRVEVSRRLLAADARLRDAGADAAVTAPPTGRGVRLGVALALVAVLAGSIALYMRIGAPGYGDQPLEQRIAAAKEMRDTRPSQEAAEADMPVQPQIETPDPQWVELIGKLRQAVAERPDDIQGLTLLARNEAALGNFAAAHRAQGKLIALKGDEASAQDHVDHADMMILAAGGYISPEAEAALRRALDIEATNGAARYYLGLMMAQTGRPDVTFRMWEALLRDSDPEDPWVTPIRAQIELAAQRAGVDYTLPELPDGAAAPVLPGPDADAVRDAETMSEGDRTEMIRGMVARLSERLASEGGPPEEWARLINAYGVLGEEARAAEIWAEARDTFAGEAEALATIQAAARAAGVAE